MVHTISPQASAEEASFPHLVLLSIAILSVVALLLLPRPNGTAAASATNC
jgi:hypothetical protein